LTRLAFVSPLPPTPTGIADYSADVLHILAERYAIDVFHDQDPVDAGHLPRACHTFPASGLLERHWARPYALVVYQMGNAPAHAFQYPLLSRLPGLLVLHDLVLHHSRARMFLDSPEARAYAADPSSAALRKAALPSLEGYRQELAYTYPKQADRLAEAHLATVGDLLPYAYPLSRIPIECSRATAVHNEYMARSIREELPSAHVFRVPMPVEPGEVTGDDVARIRERHGIAQDELVVGSFGLLTREKRIETVARAVARAAVRLPRLRLLLVGPVPDAQGLARMLDDLHVSAQTIVTGRVPFDELKCYMGAADIAVHLRYPTARETSAALLRLLAQARPAVISDLEHLSDLPNGAVLRCDVAEEEGAVTRAILRLAADRSARERLGRNARSWIEREHTKQRCLEGYVEAIEAARRLPEPPPRPWPSHWPRPAGGARAS
jgi:glycosyltransferase involved in cell wall biosynthesis